MKKEKAKILFSNFKLLSFIPYAKIDSFYKLIKNKYNKSYPEFFIYFEKYYLSSKKFSKEIWNYSNIIFNNLNNNIIFFTNNICESFNRTLNKKYIGYCKTMYNFKKNILDIIDIYTMHCEYKEKNISLTRALAYYVKINNCFLN